MISQNRISILLPSTSADIEAIAADIITVAKAFCRGGEDKQDHEYFEFLDWLCDFPQVLTMVYVDGQPAAWIRIDDHDVNPDEVGRKCLEFSGAIVPELQGQGLTEAVSPLAIQKAFERSGAKKMIAVTDGDNPAAAAALTALGFNYRATNTDGKRIYRLLRKENAEETQPAEV